MKQQKLGQQERPHNMMLDHVLLTCLIQTGNYCDIIHRAKSSVLEQIR